MITNQTKRQIPGTINLRNRKVLPYSGGTVSCPRSLEVLRFWALTYCTEAILSLDNQNFTTLKIKKISPLHRIRASKIIGQSHRTKQERQPKRTNRTKSFKIERRNAREPHNYPLKSLPTPQNLSSVMGSRPENASPTYFRTD